jgi:hypothetical protein
MFWFCRDDTRRLPWSQSERLVVEAVGGVQFE